MNPETKPSKIQTKSDILPPGLSPFYKQAIVLPVLESQDIRTLCNSLYGKHCKLLPLQDAKRKLLTVSLRQHGYDNNDRSSSTKCPTPQFSVGPASRT